MPDSSNACDIYFENDLKSVIRPKSVFDIGVGYGKSGKIVKRLFPDAEITGFEIFKKYIDDKQEIAGFVPLKERYQR